VQQVAARQPVAEPFRPAEDADHGFALTAARSSDDGGA
jgi:hypothetical protein